jgi:hypothetical protein
VSMMAMALVVSNDDGDDDEGYGSKDATRQL